MIRLGKYLEFLWSGKKEKINVLSCSLIILERLMDNSSTPSEQRTAFKTKLLDADSITKTFTRLFEEKAYLSTLFSIVEA